MNKNKILRIFSIILSAIAFTTLCFVLTSKAQADQPVYEEADIINVRDLKYKNGGNSVGNVLQLTANTAYSYTATAAHKSAIFKFKYKCIHPSTVDCQIHFSDQYLEHDTTNPGNAGVIWLRNDNTFIKKLESGYVEGTTKPFPDVQAYDVEAGKLYILDGDNKGKYYLYVKVNNVLLNEYVITAMPDKANIFLTGKNGDAIIDSDWVGNKITFISNGETILEYNTAEDYIVKPVTDPSVANKEFVGWFDKMGREWDFENNQVTGDLTLKAGFRSEETVSDETYFSDTTYTPVLRFMVSSDVHIGTNSTNRDTNLQNAILKAYEIAENNQKYDGLDALLFAGDISDNGDNVALTSFKNTATANIKTGTELVVSMGNHDFRGASVNESISQFANLFGPVDKHLVINGYHFITLSPDLSQGEHFSESKVAWLDVQLASAQEADPTKPIFVMQHEHIKGTVYGSDAWYVTELTDVISKYPQVVDFSGHSHYPLSDPRSIWQGSFTALGTGTLHYYETGINGYKNTGIFPKDKNGGWGTSPSSNSSAAEFLVVEIDANNAIRVIAYDLVSETEIARYYIRNAMDEIKFKYSHTERAKESEEPTFDSSNDLVLTPVKATIKVKFDQAICKDVVESYRIMVYKDEELKKTEYVLSDYFFKPTPESIEYTVTGLASDTDYNIEVYAVNAWGMVSSTPLTGSTRTEEVIYEPETYADYDDLNVMDFNYPDNNGILENIPTEYTSVHYLYPGTSPTYTVKVQFYLLTGNITSQDEFRIQLGTRETYSRVLWIQKGNLDRFYFNWKFSSTPSDKTPYNIQSNSMYKIEYAVLLVETGEHEGEGYTYLKVNDVLIREFYIDYEELFGANSPLRSHDYEVALHLSNSYKMVDVRLARTIEYYVDDEKVEERFALSGLKTEEPTAPTKEGLFFVGWYTDPVDGERVDFNEPFVSEDLNPKLYARFTDTTYNVDFYDDEGNKIDTQTVGKDCKIIKPINPTKTGEYRYSFVKWVIKGTNTEFDFNTRLQEDLDLEAVFEEYKFRIVYLVDGLEYVTKYFVESNPTIIIGGEPSTPELYGATGYWEYSDSRSNKDIYASARYNGISTTTTNDISLNKFNGATVDIADDLTRFYLSFADTDEQAVWIDSYPVSGGHERQNITFNWSDSSRNVNYLVYFADNIEFENAFIVETSERSIDYVGIFTPGKTYYWKVVGLTTKKSSAVDSFTVLNTPVRWISSGTVFNVRDLGGWTTTDGKMINYGFIYRGGQLSLDGASERSYMDDYAFKVFDYLKMRSEIELRGDMPHSLNQFNELGNIVNVTGANYMGLFSLKAEVKQHYRDTFALLADPKNYPVYFHCSWGADRTGSLGFLINGVLGVPFEQLVEDYELTSLSYSGVRTRLSWSNGAFMDMYNAFMNIYSDGGSLQDAITKYLKEYIGVTQEQIDSLKNIMLSDASGALATYTVTYKVDGNVYQRSKVFAGECIKQVAPIFFDKYLDYWLLDGQRFDPNTPINSDLVLEGVFAEIIYEDYDVVTIRDLGLGETYSPNGPGIYSYEGTAPTGGRMFEFDYEIVANDNEFNDGVHIEFGPGIWECRAHLWFSDLTSLHIFVDGKTAKDAMILTATYNRHLEYGETYRIKAGVVTAVNGDNAGKKLFVILINNEVVCSIPTIADITSNYSIGFAGTEGKLKSVPNKMKVKFVDSNGETLETKEITRGMYVSEISVDEIENKVFLGWFDELGNLWNFNTKKVLKDTTLFAKFSDKTINATIIDENDIEISHGYKVRIGAKVSEIELPLVPSDKLVFDAWYNGETKLNDTDLITEDMNLICVFKIVESEEPVEPVEPVNPVEPVDPTEPVDPVEPSKGCGSVISKGLYLVSLAVVAFGITFTKKKKRNERD